MLINNLKKIAITFLLLLPFIFIGQIPHKKIRVLFLGNSYTYVNNLPLLIQNIAYANGDTLIYDSNCIGGYFLYDHYNDATSCSKISAGGWDYVVLQGQSQEPSFPPAQVSYQTLPFAIKLDSLVDHYNPCATTVYYETWGRKYGDSGNCPSYPPVCTYTGMQGRLKESYKLFADTTHGIMAPVGEAFRAAISSSPAIDLYQSDQSHPSMEGSYVAAAVFYETLFHKSVANNTYNPGVGSNLLFFQQKASSTVNDSLAVWNIGKYTPVADFEVNSSQTTFTFQSASGSGFQHAWYFSDGSVSYLQNPVHTFSASGSFTVSHTVFNTCKKDSASSTITVTMSTNGLKEMTDDRNYALFPNPCKNVLNLKYDESLKDNMVLTIINSLGQIVYTGIPQHSIDLSNLENGIYCLRLSGQDFEKRLSFVKQE